MKRRSTRRWAVWLLALAIFGFGTWSQVDPNSFESFFAPTPARAEESTPLELADSEAAELPSAETIQANLLASWENTKDLRFEWVVEWFKPENGALEERTRFDGFVLLPHFIRLTVQEPDFMAGAIFIYRGDRNHVIVYNPIWETPECMAPEAFAREYGIVLSDDANEFLLEELLGVSEESLETLTVVGSETIDGVSYVKVQLAVEGAADQLATQIEQIEGIDDIEDLDELAESVVAWIDTDRWIIAKVETWDAEGRVTSRQQLNNLTINTGLTINQVVQLRANTRNCN